MGGIITPGLDPAVSGTKLFKFPPSHSTLVPKFQLHFHGLWNEPLRCKFELPFQHFTGGGLGVRQSVWCTVVCSPLLEFMLVYCMYKTSQPPSLVWPNYTVFCVTPKLSSGFSNLIPLTWCIWLTYIPFIWKLTSNVLYWFPRSGTGCILWAVSVKGQSFNANLFRNLTFSSYSHITHIFCCWKNSKTWVSSALKLTLFWNSCEMVVRLDSLVVG